MKLAIANDWFDKKSAVFYNQDGFLKALQVLGEEWEVKFFKKHDSTFQFEHPCVELNFSPDPHGAVMRWKPDAILFFADFSRPILGQFKGCGIPMGQAYSGGDFRDYEDVADIVFVESECYLNAFRERGLNTRLAFGTNTELFRPMPQPKIFDAVFPATMAGWKRHELFGEAMGPKGLACGYWHPTETNPVTECQKYGVAMLHHQWAESTALIYNMGKTCVITSTGQGGSQRTVLEALSCNVPVITMRDSDKTSEFLEKGGTGEIVPPRAVDIRKAVDKWKDKEINSRDWVKKHYSERVYANQLKEGILSIC